MKIVILNIEFDFNTGCRLLKLQHDECPYPELEDLWDDIQPSTFAEIAQFANLEHRRVGIACLGLERLIEEVQPELVDTQTLTKTTSWVTPEGLKTFEFEDTYELYRVSGSYFSENLPSWQKMSDSFFVKCKDTSTDRIYLIWVDLKSVREANGLKTGWEMRGNITEGVNAIQAIAWTVQTDVPEGEIEKIIRQGDCVLIKPNNEFSKPLKSPRHLTEKEYLTLLTAES